MKTIWLPIVVEQNYKEKEILTYRDWCEFIRNPRASWQVLKSQVLRHTRTVGEYKEVLVFESYHIREGMITLAGFFKENGIDFRIPRTGAPYEKWFELELYFYQLMKAGGYKFVCQNCGYVKKNSSKACLECGKTEAEEITLTIDRLDDPAKKPQVEVKVLPSKGPSEDENLNSAFRRTKPWKRHRQ